MKVEIVRQGSKKVILVDGVQVSGRIGFGDKSISINMNNNFTQEQKSEIIAEYKRLTTATQTAQATQTTQSRQANSVIKAKYAGFDAESGEPYGVGAIICKTPAGWVKADNY